MQRGEILIGIFYPFRPDSNLIEMIFAIVDSRRTSPKAINFSYLRVKKIEVAEALHSLNIPENYFLL